MTLATPLCIQEVLLRVGRLRAKQHPQVISSQYVVDKNLILWAHFPIFDCCDFILAESAWVMEYFSAHRWRKSRHLTFCDSPLTERRGYTFESQCEKAPAREYTTRGAPARILPTREASTRAVGNVIFNLSRGGSARCEAKHGSDGVQCPALRRCAQFGERAALIYNGRDSFKSKSSMIFRRSQITWY
jgi:hypothetical protein